MNQGDIQPMPTNLKMDSSYQQGKHCIELHTCMWNKMCLKIILSKEVILMRKTQRS